MKNKKKLFYILLVVTIILLPFILARKEFQNDIFYSIKVGEEISLNGIDMKDHFSNSENLAYTYPHWLYDLTIYKIYDIGGFPLIYISTIVLTMILLTTMYITANSIIKDKGISYILMLFIAFNIESFVTARAQLVTYILFLLILYFIEKLRKKGKNVYILLILFSSFLIANIHCAVWSFIFVLFLPFLANDLIDFLKTKYKSKIDCYKREHNLSQSRIEIENSKYKNKTLITFFLIIVTGFMTPNFLVPFYYLIKTKMGISMEHISEHLPTNIAERPSLFIILGLVFILMLQGNMKIKLRDLLLMGGLALLSLLSRRSFSLFIILSIFSFARLLDCYMKKRTKIKIENVLSNNVIFVTMISLIFLTSLMMVYKDKDNDYVNSKKYPIELSNYITNNLDLSKIKIYNGYDYGSYLLFRGVPVFIDSRADLYLEEFNKGCTVFEDSLDIFNKYGTVFKKYNFTHIILKNTDNLSILLRKDKNYKLEYIDDYFTMFKVNID